MKAVIQTKYGSPDALQLEEVAKPTPADNEVLVKVYTASVTPSDCAFRKGEPILIRLMYGLLKPRLPIGGVEFAGKIEAVGKEVSHFKIGDEVFGMSPDRFGAYAEYVCVRADKAITTKSSRMTYEEAVAIVDGATTALTFLSKVADVGAGQKVLINGASGAVGGYAVQIARHLGAEVTGVCSTRNIEWVKSLGADHVIDYTQEDFTRRGETYDVIFDAVGKRLFAECRAALTSNGVYMTTVPSLGSLFYIIWTAIGSGKKARFTTAGLEQNKGTLDSLNALFEAGAIKATIDRRYSLEQIPDAHRYVDTERKRGNVIITVVQSDIGDHALEVHQQEGALP